MAEVIVDSPNLGKPYCGECDNEGGFVRDLVKEIWYAQTCSKHAITGATYLSGSVEIDPVTNRNWNELLNRGAARAEGE